MLKHYLTNLCCCFSNYLNTDLYKLQQIMVKITTAHSEITDSGFNPLI